MIFRPAAVQTPLPRVSAKPDVAAALPVTFELRALVARGKFSLTMHEFNSCILNDPVFCFKSSALDDIDDDAVLAFAPYTRPPFPTCMFELEIVPAVSPISHFVGVIVDTHDVEELTKFTNARIVMEIVGRHHNRQWLKYGLFWTDGHTTTFEPPDGEDFGEDIHQKLAASADGLVCRGCYAIQAGNRIDHCEVSGVRRTMMRDKGVTGFTYKLVHVDPTRRVAKSEPQGGTHASPRWHMRRAHTRRLLSGRTIEVRACSVGRKDVGAVVKDYIVEGDHSCGDA